MLADIRNFGKFFGSNDQFKKHALNRQTKVISENESKICENERYQQI